MKNKKIITIVASLAIASTLLVSCGKKNNETSTADTNTTNKITSETSTDETGIDETETNTAETNTNETSTESKEEPSVKVNIPEELSKENTAGDAFYLTMDIDSSKEDIVGEVFELVDKSGVTNREIISNTDEKDGNVLVGLYSDKTLKNVKLYDIDSEKLETTNNDYATYVKDSLEGTKCLDIMETLENTQFLGIKCKQGDKSAEQILVWENESGEKQYLPIYFK
ncbi:MAG: hypothetical protein SOY42_02130 [Clostridium sp.]|nr:hypothetical protein [Clostridium sp.]